MPLYDKRLLKSRVLHGVAAEIAIATAIGFAFGPVGLAIFVLQATTAVMMLEAVNYFEHYGLIRRMKRVRPIDSWDTDSWFSLYSLVGLSRHADHHAFASRPYQQLRHWEQSPKLPYGYFGMVWMVLTQNEKFRTTLEALLREHALGPFETDEATEALAGAKAA
jgi:alkane 1-monooxygenase